MADTRVLLLGDATSDGIAKVLGRLNRTLVRIGDPAEVAAAASDADVVVIDVVPPPSTVADVCRDLRAVPALAEVPILAISGGEDVEERIRLLEAGADDVMMRPVDERELDARVEALDLRHRRAKELRPATTVVATTKRPGRRLVVVFSPKGGVGTTTVAVNLALAMAARTPDLVALVDLAPVGGQVVTHMDVKPKLTLADLARDMSSIASPETIRSTYLTRHAGGVFVLAGSPSPASSALLGGDDVARVLESVMATMPTVVVDAGSYIDDRTLAALELADDALVVVTPDFPALKSVHSFFEYLRETGSHVPEPMVVVNEIYAVSTLSPSDIENALQRRATMRLPYDAMLYLRAANQGTPVFASATTSEPARRFDQLAAVILGEDAPNLTPEPRRRGLAGLFSRG